MAVHQAACWQNAVDCVPDLASGPHFKRALSLWLALPWWLRPRAHFLQYALQNLTPLPVPPPLQCTFTAVPLSGGAPVVVVSTVPEVNFTGLAPATQVCDMCCA